MRSSDLHIPIELEGTGFAFAEITAIKGLHENKTQCFEVDTGIMLARAGCVKIALLIVPLVMQSQIRLY